MPSLYQNLNPPFLHLIGLFILFLIPLFPIYSKVYVGGFMHFWGLTIDTSSAVLLTVAMGLAVDYAAHVGRHIHRENLKI